MIGLGWKDFGVLIATVVLGEVLTGVKKWTDGMKGNIGWSIVNGICGKLARILPTLSDLK